MTRTLYECWKCKGLFPEPLEDVSVVFVRDDAVAYATARRPICPRCIAVSFQPAVRRAPGFRVVSG